MYYAIIHFLLTLKILDSDIIGSNFSITTTKDYEIPAQDMPPDDDVLMNSLCQQFMEANDFYSPGFPQHYPNNTECIRTIEGIQIKIILKEIVVLEDFFFWQLALEK